MDIEYTYKSSISTQSRDCGLSNESVIGTRGFSPTFGLLLAPTCFHRAPCIVNCPGVECGHQHVNSIKRSSHESTISFTSSRFAFPCIQPIRCRCGDPENAEREAVLHHRRSGRQ